MNMEARIRGIGMTSQRTRLRLVDRLRASGIKDESVLQAMADVPRHCFVDEAMASRAYDDCSLPIGEGQTISQPYVVALMTELVVNSGLNGKKINKVLEIGTGSGYQAAVLSKLVPTVYTLERVRTLVHRAGDRLRQLGLRNIRTRYTDGVEGWSENGPFDAVIVTAAMETVPQALLGQVADGGVLVGPVGAQQGTQQLATMRCRAGQAPQLQKIEEVRFVPFLSGKC
ncbi:protein-L-isoaspartate O-methyltransferase [Chromatiales bacterium (ex Bugula neritina AB1)]|nr:protein-L-isoaspartate O-methyltransferase [Chromatiales bacterium (ex Bugula neritina AB1)]